MDNLKHIAIIPDGNRRWAKKRGLPEWRGHKKGADRFIEITKASFNAGIPYFTFWALSEDNFSKRPKTEINFLLKLFSQTLKKFSKDPLIKKKEVKIRFFGKWKRVFPGKLVKEIINLEKQTKENNKNFLSIMLVYDGRSEMITAIEKIAEFKVKSSRPGRASSRAAKLKVDENLLKDSLWTADLPDVDLVIRTGGEPHWSAGFMMWHTANSQLYFTKKFWPDFDKKELDKALKNYSLRERRLGK